MLFQPLGDSAVLIRFDGGINDETLQSVQRCLAALDAAPPAAVTEVVPAYDSLAVFFDPARRRESPAELFAALRAELTACCTAATSQPAAAAPRRVEIDVRYGGADGPDLDDVARHAGITAERVVALHTAALYRVAMIGFAPGFPYLTGLDPALETPRRASPRTRVPAGSVGIAGRQTGIYPLDSPGGWQLIGRTAAQLFQPDADPPTLLRAGDRVRFRALT